MGSKEPASPGNPFTRVLDKPVSTLPRRSSLRRGRGQRFGSGPKPQRFNKGIGAASWAARALILSLKEEVSGTEFLMTDPDYDPDVHVKAGRSKLRLCSVSDRQGARANNTTIRQPESAQEKIANWETVCLGGRSAAVLTSSLSPEGRGRGAAQAEDGRNCARLAPTPILPSGSRSSGKPVFNCAWGSIWRT
jgi:hypothetical protein